MSSEMDIFEGHCAAQGLVRGSLPFLGTMDNVHVGTSRLADSRKLATLTLVVQELEALSIYVPKIPSPILVGGLCLFLKKYVDQYFQDTNVTCNQFPSENYQ